MIRRLFVMANVVILALGAAGQCVLENGSFEDTKIVSNPVTKDLGYGQWIVKGEKLLFPSGWECNPFHTGILEVLESPEVKHYLRISTAPDYGRGAHLIQKLRNFKSGATYKVSGLIRGTDASMGFYTREKGETKVSLCYRVTEQKKWKPFYFYFTAPHGHENFGTFYIGAGGNGRNVEVASLELKELDMPEHFSSEPVVLENKTAKIVFSPQGILTELIDKRTGKNYAKSNEAAFSMKDPSGAIIPFVGISRLSETRLGLYFAGSKDCVELFVKTYDNYFTVMVAKADAGKMSYLKFFGIESVTTEQYGSILCTASKDGFSVVGLSCNDKTHVSSSCRSTFAVNAACYKEYGIEGAKAVVAALPKAELLDTMEKVEIEQGLLHPVRDGVWLRKHPGRFASYMMTSNVTEESVDEIVEFAKGGFGIIHITDGWWESTPTYVPNIVKYPDGLDSLKRIVDKIHGAGLQAGLHTMQGMVGWSGRLGIRSDYVTPYADPRLKQSHKTVLKTPVDDKAVEIEAAGNLKDWPEKGDLRINGEVVRYTAKAGNKFTGCIRGLHSSTKLSHAAGTEIGLLVNCFPHWGGCIYTPEIESTMFEEILTNLTNVFNYTGADMAYFDAGEEWMRNPPAWRNNGRFALEFQKRLHKPIFLGGNVLYTNLSWHAVTRGAPNYDPMYYGRDEFSMLFKGTNPQRNAVNLLVGDCGWFEPHCWSKSTDAVTPDELMLINLKAVAGKSPFSMHMSHGRFFANKRMPEMMFIIKLCDQLKREESLDEEALLAMQGRKVRHVLEPKDKDWVLRELNPSRSMILHAGEKGFDSLTAQNPHGKQTPALRIRALPKLAAYGEKGNMTLASFEDGELFKVNGTASGQLVMSVQKSTEKAPDGSAAIRIKGVNSGKQKSGWGRLVYQYETTKNLVDNRYPALWVKSNGAGGILNVQLTSDERAGSVREHYIDLDFTGWRLFVLDSPETYRFYDYGWPYSFTGPMYRAYPYHKSTGLALYLNAIPAGKTAEVEVGRIEALKEIEVPVTNPAVEIAGRKLTFPVSLLPNEYLECDRDGNFNLYTRNGGLLLKSNVKNTLEWPKGSVEARFSCDAADTCSNRAELTLYAVGQVFRNIKLKTPNSLPEEKILLQKGDKGALRATCGLAELESFDGPQVMDLTDRNNCSINVNTRWTDGKERKAAMVLSYKVAGVNIDEKSTVSGLLALGNNFKEEKDNQYHKYVMGGGPRRVTEQGVVNGDIDMGIQVLPEDKAHGGNAIRFRAFNKGNGAGWCGKGMKFSKIMDFSGFNATSLWIDGDGQNEVVRVQFWDKAGKYADWQLKINFKGWKRFVLDNSLASKGFDWSQVEYFVLVYNNLPLQRETSLAIAGLSVHKATKNEKSSLNSVTININGESILADCAFDVGQSLLILPNGDASLWNSNGKLLTSAKIKGANKVLRLIQGTNKITLDCNAALKPSALEVKVLAAP